MKLGPDAEFWLFHQVTFEIPAVCPPGVTHQPPLRSSRAMEAAEGWLEAMGQYPWPVWEYLAPLASAVPHPQAHPIVRLLSRIFLTETNLTFQNATWYLGLRLIGALSSTVMPSSPTIPGSSSSSSSLLPFSSFPSAAKQKSAFAPVLRPQGSPSPACPASGGNSFRGSHPTHYLTPLSELTNAV